MGYRSKVSGKTPRHGGAHDFSWENKTSINGGGFPMLPTFILRSEGLRRSHFVLSSLLIGSTPVPAKLEVEYNLGTKKARRQDWNVWTLCK